MNKQKLVGPIGIGMFIACIVNPDGVAFADNRIAACYSKPRGQVNILKVGIPNEDLNISQLTERCKTKFKGIFVLWAIEGPVGAAGATGTQGPIGATGSAGPGEPDCLNPTRGDNLVGCDLTLPTVNFALAQNDLRGIRATGAILNNESPLGGYNFIGADFTGASLETSSFGGANLQFADFSGANYGDSNFTGADLCGAKIGVRIVVNRPGYIMNSTTICPNNHFAERWTQNGDGPFECAIFQLTPADVCSPEAPATTEPSEG